MAPICPYMLLKALDPLLSDQGGIKRMKEVERMSSLMLKFSKKLVSRTMYCKILQATQPDLLSQFLDIDGWNTLNTWLQDAHRDDNTSFLLEMMRLYKLLPMTVDRLKANNTAKLIKTLTKHDDSTVGNLAGEIVQSWMTLIKREKPEEPKPKKKKKERRRSEENSATKITTKSEDESSMDSKVGTGTRGISSSEDDDEKRNKENDVLQPLMFPEPLPKKPPKPDRPKTVKTYQGKFRSTGLEDANPLPTRPKKVAPSDPKAPPAKPPLKRTPSVLENLIPEKKAKSSLNLTSTAKPQQPGGVKLIAPRPKPIHVLQESASFMDALTSAPVPAVRRKKKTPATPKSPTTPPNTAPPKLQFYKDTLEMADKEESKENKEGDGGSEASNDTAATSEETKDQEPDEAEPEETVQRPPPVPGQPQSILSHCKRRSRKKSVQWREDSKLVDVRLFDLDENERVNVNKLHQNFVDLKMLEMRKERQAFEYAKRRHEDKMEEAIPWRMPSLISLPPPPVEIGFQSVEKKVQSLHQQSTLQELYFTKESLPDSPHEPEPEMVVPSEPKLIPLEDVANPGAVVDYSNMDLHHSGAALPPVLSNLVNSIVKPPAIPNLLVPPPPMDPYLAGPAGALMPGDHRTMPPPQRPGLLDPPPIFDRPPPPIYQPPSAIPDGGTWCSLDGGPSLPQQPMYPLPVPPPIRGPGPRWPNNNRNQTRMRGGGGVQRVVVCKHFKMGNCRFGNKCTFIHPGV